MLLKIFIVISGIALGIFLGYFFVSKNLTGPLQTKLINPLINQKQVIGFLPYWLIGDAAADYSKYISDLTYFGLKIDVDGSVLKLTGQQESEPGWNALDSGNLDQFFTEAKKHNVQLSLLLSCGDHDTIASIIDDPKAHAQNLLTDVLPVMRKYGFSDLNLDIEDPQAASDQARLNFTQFVKEVKNGLERNHTGTVTIDISPDDFIHKKLIDPRGVGTLADRVVLMTYDYHSTASFVTGPVAPLSGAGVISEYDVDTAVQKALQIIPAQKIILGIPLYGYEWETTGSIPRSAVIPGTGISESNEYVENFLASCTNCSSKTDTDAEETYITYKDQETGTYHQIFYPDKQSVSAKISYANQEQLGGIALWALGYEGRSILDPLRQYKN